MGSTQGVFLAVPLGKDLQNISEYQTNVFNAKRQMHPNIKIGWLALLTFMIAIRTRVACVVVFVMEMRWNSWLKVFVLIALPK
jgi:hypothetical protein